MNIFVTMMETEISKIELLEPELFGTFLCGLGRLGTIVSNPNTEITYLHSNSKSSNQNRGLPFAIVVLCDTPFMIIPRIPDVLELCMSVITRHVSSQISVIRHYNLQQLPNVIWEPKTLPERIQ